MKWMATEQSNFIPCKALKGGQASRAIPRLFFVAHAASTFGTWLAFITIINQIAVAHASTFPLALAILARRLPSALSAPLGGYLTDRCNPRKLAFALNMAMAAFVIVLVLGATFAMLPLGLLVIVYVCLSLCDGMYKPAVRGLLARACYSAVELGRATATLNLIATLMVVSSGTVAALVVRKDFSAYILAFDSLTFVLAAFGTLVVSAVATGMPSTKAATSPVRLRGDIVIVLIVMNVFYALLTLIVAKYPNEVYHNGLQGMGVLYAVLALSTLIVTCGLKIARWDQPDHVLTGWKPVAALTLFCMAISAVSSFPIAIWLFAGAMICFCLLKVGIERQILLGTRREFVGRSVSRYNTIEELTIAVTLLLVSGLFDPLQTHRAGLAGISAMAFALVLLPTGRIMGRVLEMLRISGQNREALCTEPIHLHPHPLDSTSQFHESPSA